MLALIELEDIHTGPHPQPFRVLLMTVLALRESAASLNLMSSAWVTCWYLFALASNIHCSWHAEVQHSWCHHGNVICDGAPVAAKINSSKSMKKRKSWIRSEGSPLLGVVFRMPLSWTAAATWIYLILINLHSYFVCSFSCPFTHIQHSICSLCFIFLLIFVRTLTLWSSQHKI